MTSRWQIYGLFGGSSCRAWKVVRSALVRLKVLRYVVLKRNILARKGSTFAVEPCFFVAIANVGWENCKGMWLGFDGAIVHKT